ncbi:MAG: type II toxin-antitoxin system VapB family antitoxin [Deltaproteobacteria bacterium]|nr:type II toxin-antitoxin system VapB family antitoxin [Deltaproteobacteria bacterium]
MPDQRGPRGSAAVVAVEYTTASTGLDSSPPFHHHERVALNIKNREAETLAAEVAGLAGESMTQAVISALADRRAALLRRRGAVQRLADVRDFLEREVWTRPTLGDPLPDDHLLGYGPSGA